MALYVSSHYKNTPNDLMLMSDAPAHHLFVLLGPVDESKGVLPDILCVIQVDTCISCSSFSSLLHILALFQAALTLDSSAWKVASLRRTC